MKSDWLISLGPRGEATTRLFCFPPAASSVSEFCDWPTRLPESIEVVGVQLPGRQFRIRERPFETLQPLMDVLLREIVPELTPRYAFFGHSMGALVAFELARALRRGGHALPSYLILAGHRAPHVPSTSSRLHHLPDQELLAGITRLNGLPHQVLQQRELMSLILPLLRADLAVCETYRYAAEPPLPCPMAAFGGSAEVTRNELEEWRQHTSAGFCSTLFHGEHFFIRSAQHQVLARVASLLAPTPTR